MSELSRLADRLVARRVVASADLKGALRRVDPAAFVAEGYGFLAYEDVPVPYDTGLGGPGLLPSRRWAAVLHQLLSPAEADDFLLVGSDGGYLAALLGATNPGARVTVVEPDARRALRTREHLAQGGFAAEVTVSETLPEGTWSRILRLRSDTLPEAALRDRLRDLGVLLFPRRTPHGPEMVRVVRSGSDFGEIAFRDAAPGRLEEGMEAAVNLTGLLALEELLENVWRESPDTPRDRYFWEMAESTFQGGPWDRGELTKAEMERLLLAKRVFRLAHICQMTGDFQNAERLYRKSLEAYPTAEAHTFLGWTYSFVERIEDAIRECHKAIAVDASLGNPYNDIGAYLIQLGRLDEAIPWLQQATRAARYCCYFYAHCNLGRVHLMKGDLEAARDAFQKALEVNPDYDLARQLLQEVERHLGT